MASFAEQIRGAVVTAETAGESPTAKRFLGVLNELADGLDKLGVGARIGHGPDPRRHVLYLYPRHRPARANLMLSFFLDGESIIASGESPITFSSPERLEAWLLEFVKLPAFIESLHTLREEATRPVEARLATSATGNHAKGDILVQVSASDQSQLAEATKGVLTALTVRRIDFPGNAQFAKSTKYKLLDSAGLVLRVEDVSVVQGCLRIDGVKE